MTIEVKKAYHLMAKLKGDKKFSGVGGEHLQSKRIHYSVFEMTSSADVARFESVIEALTEDNEGSEFKARLVEDWKVN